MTHPSGTAYQRGLYSIDGVPKVVQDVFETKFMSVADGQAARILTRMIEHNIVPSGVAKGPWARLIMSLWYRTPEVLAKSKETIRKHYEEDDLEKYRADYLAKRRPEDPETLEAYLSKTQQSTVGRATIELLLDVIQSDRVGEAIMGMQWAMARMRELRHPLLTSDRPIVMYNGLKYPESHIVMPISPRHIFIAANSDKTTAELRDMARDGSLATKLNDRVVKQARKFVYGSDDQQLRFVENRLGAKIPCSPIE